jgi:SAM-dependent methyltransferase
MEWWRALFSSSLWQGLQLSWEEADDADEDAERVARALGLDVPSRVLDVPCGTGRIGRRLRASGHHVVGVDITPAFLAEARRSDLPVIRADMRSSVVRPGAFDVAVCVWGSFGYFDEGGNRRQAQALADALAPGGRCLVDTIVADTILPAFEPTAQWEVGGVRVDEARRYDEATKRIETTWTFTRGDERATHVTSVRLYSLAELTDLFADVGFASFLALDDELVPFAPPSTRLWLVATVAGRDDG